jgi:basic amino acid/polyamine antiporter, APA family
MPEAQTQSTPGLRRRLGLPLLVLYGVGITIGAGIYVLVGAVAGRSGIYSHWAFVIAAVVMALTVASYAEMATRIPSVPARRLMSRRRSIRGRCRPQPAC